MVAVLTRREAWVIRSRGRPCSWRCPVVLRGLAHRSSGSRLVLLPLTPERGTNVGIVRAIRRFHRRDHRLDCGAACPILSAQGSDQSSCCDAMRASGRQDLLHRRPTSRAGLLASGCRRHRRGNHSSRCSVLRRSVTRREGRTTCDEAAHDHSEQQHQQITSHLFAPDSEDLNQLLPYASADAWLTTSSSTSFIREP